MRLTAEQAIEKIKSERTNFFGINVRKINYSGEIRDALQKMSEDNEISPKEYKRALDITFQTMFPGEKRSEYEKLS